MEPEPTGLLAVIGLLATSTQDFSATGCGTGFGVLGGAAWAGKFAEFTWASSPEPLASPTQDLLVGRLRISELWARRSASSLGAGADAGAETSGDGDSFTTPT